MPGVQEFSQQVRSIIDVVIRFVRARKREEASISFGALLILAGVYLASGLEKVGLKEFFASWHGEDIVRGLLIAVGIGFVLFGAYKIFRLVYVPPPPIAKDRPSAIKGPMAFTEADGELFRKLGRESELQKLLGLALDDQVLMIVVRGASGAGKTSLLRAGLKHILGDRAIFHYWEAVPTEPDKGLLRALQEKWPEGATKPASLDELVNPAETLGRQSHVIVLDQFEQLRGSRKMFALLRRIIRESKPPHRITWVIAFRREFSADWLDFVSPEIERGIRPPQDVSLRLFTADQAREVIGQLVNESNLKDSIEQSVINNLVEAATVESEVSPVDIGIGLLVLAELHERQSGNTITIRDYQFAGGAEGLLTQYISRCLDLFPKEHQEAILKAMLALRDAETNQRLAEGLTVDVLAKESGAEARLLKTQLDRLSHRDTRLLETFTPPDGSPTRYRLPHERLIPALYRLTGKLLAEVDQAKLKFQNAFQAWKTNDKRRAYLLKAKELKLVERYETQIPWGKDQQEKKGFLFRSKRYRTFARVGLMTAVVALITAGWISALLYQRYEHKQYLYDSGYPRELYDWQDQLKKVELAKPLDLERFNWLSSDSIEELSLQATHSTNSVAGLASLSKCRKLAKLRLDLYGEESVAGRIIHVGTEVSDLTPLGKLTGLRELTLNSRLSNLKPLEQLTGLRELTLNSPVSDLKSLEQLKGLQRLTLDLSESDVSDLKPLEQLKGLQQLTLKLGSQVSDLKPLEQLKGLQELTLKLLNSPVSDLKSLEQLKGLQRLTLDLRESEVSDLKSLEQLKGLQRLTLDLRESEVSDLKSLEQLKGLKELTVDHRATRVSDLMPLKQLTGLQELTLINSQASDLKALEQLKGLQRLTLKLGSQVSDLKPLEQLKGLQELTLDLQGYDLVETQVSDLKPLEQLKKLTQLTLILNSRVNNLKSLGQLTGLQQLTLRLLNSPVSDLKSLGQLTGLQQLTILHGSRVSDLKPLEQLKGLQQLTLDLPASRVTDLKPLEQLKGLQQLTLNLSASQVMDMKPLEQLKDLKSLALTLSGTNKEKDLEVFIGQFPKLESLSLAGLTTEQRRSLHKIPASLRELNF